MVFPLLAIFFGYTVWTPLAGAIKKEQRMSKMAVGSHNTSFASLQTHVGQVQKVPQFPNDAPLFTKALDPEDACQGIHRRMGERSKKVKKTKMAAVTMQ